MPELIVNGGRRLCGSIDMQGAKNSVLPILAATVLCNGQSILHNCPDISDVDIAVKILSELGCECERCENEIFVDASYINNYFIRDDLMRKMRSSVIFLGAILGRMKKAVISNPGGCELGPRPIDMHIASLKKLGVNIEEEHGYLSFDAKNGILGNEIILSFPSVGATENIILSAVLANGKTVIRNAAREPEIVDLINFLKGAGAKITGEGSDTLTVVGVNRLGSSEHTVIPDRIAAVTYMSFAAVTRGEITVNNIIPEHISSAVSVFREAGCSIEIDKTKLKLIASKRLKSVSTLRTIVYPGFPTDAGPMLIAMLSLAEGTSIFVENIFENRFKYIDELNRFGADVSTEGKIAVIKGVKSFSATSCECTDLRGGAALLVAALAAKGESHIKQIYHIKRGYENIAEQLNALGAGITEREE